MSVNRNFSQDLPELGISRQFASPQPVPTERFMIDRFTNPLDDTHEMAVNGSITPVSFRVPIPAAFNCLVLGIHFFICDVGIRPARFGAITALTNGCQLTFNTAAGAEITDFAGQASGFSSGVGYKTNAEWVTTAGTDIDFWFGNGNDDLLAWGYNFSKYGVSIQLVEGEYVEMLIRDDLTGIDSFQGSLVGRLVGP